MPKVVYTAVQGLVQSDGSGFDVSTTGIHGGGFYSGFIPDAAASTTASGAISVANYFTNITVDGTKAYTLADGTVTGQRKMILCSAATSSPAGTITIASPISASLDVIAISAIGDVVELVWTGVAWRILSLHNCKLGTVASPTVS